MAMDRLWMWPWKRSIDMDHHGGDSGGSIVSIGNGKKYTMISRGRLTTLFVWGCLNVSIREDSTPGPMVIVCVRG